MSWEEEERGGGGGEGEEDDDEEEEGKLRDGIGLRGEIGSVAGDDESKKRSR